MKRNIEIFRGAGAMAAFEAALIRGVLEGEGIPFGGERMVITVPAGYYRRASKLISTAFAEKESAELERAKRAGA